MCHCGQVVHISFFCGGGGGEVDPVGANLEVIQVLYLNSNVSLIISRNESN